MAFRFPPEVQEKLRTAKAYEAKKKREARAMSDASLIATMRYCIQQMPTASRYSGGDCVYDGQFFHVLLPELFKRLHAINDHDVLRQRMHTKAANDGEEEAL